MITLALALLLQATPAHEPGPPDRRAAVAGLEGFQVVSRLAFEDRALRLTATYVFPDRARWALEDAAASVSKPEQIFRHGALVHRLPFAESSLVLAGLDREHTLLQMELRRAAFLFPDGFEWNAGADAREATVFADTACRREPLGTLRARNGAGGLALEARDRAGELRESLTVVEQQELGGRRWPKRLTVTGVNGSFEETVERLETRVHYLDLAFLPGDRRRPAASERPDERISVRDLVPMTYQERALHAASDWDEAQRQARAFAEDVQRTLAGGITLDPVPTFELDEEGRPVRCLVRLARVSEPPPEGFVGHRERLGLCQTLPSLSRLDRSRLAQVDAARPSGSRVGHPYVRLYAPDRIELILPLVAE